jgi:hypothetical protein
MAHGAVPILSDTAADRTIISTVLAMTVFYRGGWARFGAHQMQYRSPKRRLWAQMADTRWTAPGDLYAGADVHVRRVKRQFSII